MVPWQPGSVWTTYPYQRHVNAIGWMPISFSGKHNTITIRADSCQGDSDQPEGRCRPCKSLPDSVKFCDFVQRASNASEHTQWDYLNLQQLQSLLTRAYQNCQQLRTQVCTGDSGITYILY